MGRKKEAKVLCVDDEPAVVDSLKHHLRKRYDVSVATSGSQALGMLDPAAPFAVILSDMRMPGMDGAALLKAVREQAPDTTRMLLTGHADMDSAIAAVNDGQIFRFLTKPCPREVLGAAFESAVELHQLRTAEKVLLEQTLHGSIKALTDILSLVSPTALGRTSRLQQLVADLADELEVEDTWHLDVAAMLSQVAYVTLPEATLEKVYFGRELTEEEVAMEGRLPRLTEQVLGHIPRLEPVREILAHMGHRYDGSDRPGLRPVGDDLPLGARLLKVSVDFDVLECRGLPAVEALDTMRGRKGWYDRAVLDALDDLRGGRGPAAEMREVTVELLQSGMVLAEDVTTRAGVLVIARGHEVTASLSERLRNMAEGSIKEPIRVVVRRLAQEEEE